MVSNPRLKPVKICRCPNCGYKKRSEVPCYAQACPRCEHPMAEE